MTLVAGIDAGTQSVKVLVYDSETREVLGAASAPLALVERGDGTREQQAQWWTAAIAECFSKIDPAIRRRIRALGVSGQQHGFVPVDAAGVVVAPVKLWCDTSTQAECDAIMAAVGGPAACIAAAGNPILAGYTASKLAWTRTHRPDAWRAMRTILLPHDYLNFWLTGERFMEAGDASGTGWLDVRTRRWSPELLAAIDPDRDLTASLPPLLDADASVPIQASTAEALGLSAEVRVSVGGGDNMMAAIGTGNVVPGRLTMSLGTSGTLFAHAAQPVVDDDARWAAFCASADGWLPLICTMNCTVATETIGRLLGLDTAAREALLADTAPGADGLLLLPFFNGERTPNLPAGRGCLHGMTPSNMTPAHLVRAAMEGATCSLRSGYDALVEAGLQFDTLLLTGGGSRSAIWRKMAADMLELPVRVPVQAEGAAFGAALQALWALQRQGGDAGTLADLVNAHVQFDDAAAALPTDAGVDAYRTQYRAFGRHLDAIAPLYRG